MLQMAGMALIKDTSNKLARTFITWKWKVTPEEKLLNRELFSCCANLLLIDILQGYFFQARYNPGQNPLQTYLEF
jgi:hypothetical protein